MSILYITEPGAELRKRAGRLQVFKSEKLLQDLPWRTVERIVLLAPVQISAGATWTLLEAGIQVFFCGRHGKYHGMLTSGDGDVEHWLIQTERWQNEVYRLAMARSIVDVKIRHQRSILRRQARNHSDYVLTEAAEQLTNLLESLGKRGTMDQIRGVEGQAAAVYFEVFGRCVRQTGIEYKSRNKRPPQDPINALLSLGYMLFLAEIPGALLSQGLHAGLGFLHAPSRRRPALALDLLEIFRQPVIDRLTLSLINRAIFNSRDFETSPGDGVRLTQDALKRYLVAYERTVTNPFRFNKYQETLTTYRTQIRQQTCALWKCLEAGEVWSPPIWEL